MNNTVAVFDCGKPVVLRCYGSINSFVYWQIDSVILLNTSYSAQCVSGFGCFVFNNFTGRYAYSYNAITGISDLRIDPVNKEEDGRKYKCNDGHQYPLNANVMCKLTKYICNIALCYPIWCIDFVF